MTTTSAARWSMARRWAPTRWSSSASAGSSRSRLADVEARVRAFQDLTHVPARGAAAVTRQYAEAGVDLEGAEAAKARIGRAVADHPHRRSASARSARSAAWSGSPRACGARPWCSAPTASAPRCWWRSRRDGSTPWARIWSTTASTTSWSTAPRPIAFMDYIAGSGLGVEQIAGLVEGIARGCRAHRMALAGGETAQMPGLYRPGTYDLAGTIIGVVEEDAAIHGDAIRPGRRAARLRVHRPAHQWVHPGPPSRVRAHGARDRRSAGRVWIVPLQTCSWTCTGATSERDAGRLAASRTGAHHGRRNPRQPGADIARRVRGGGGSRRPGICRRSSPPCSRRAGSPPRRCATCSTSASASSPCCHPRPFRPRRRRPRRMGSPPGRWARSGRDTQTVRFARP